jgi:hypothetical protein
VTSMTCAGRPYAPMGAGYFGTENNPTRIGGHGEGGLNLALAGHGRVRPPHASWHRG